MEPKEEEKTSTDFYGHNPPKPFMEMSFFLIKPLKRKSF